jgi:hypothetical protein
VEYLETVTSADFKTVDRPPVTDKVPPVAPLEVARDAIAGRINLCARTLAAAGGGRAGYSAPHPSGGDI